MTFPKTGYLILLLFSWNSTSIYAAAVDAFISTGAGQSVNIPLNLAYNNISLVNVSSGASVSINQVSVGASGRVIFTYTPALGFTGGDAFIYSATYSGVVSNATVTVQVGSFNTPRDPIGVMMLHHIQKMCASGAGGQAPTSLVNLCSDISVATPQEQAAFLRQLTPLALAGQNRFTQQLAIQQIDNVRKRLANLRLSISGTNSLSQLYFNWAGKAYAVADLFDSLPTGAGASADEVNSVGYFVSGLFGVGGHDQSVYEAGYDSFARGITAGLDYRITDKFVAGVAFGNNNSNIEVDNKGGYVDIGGYSLLAYTSYYLTAKSYVETVWSVHKNFLDTTRNLDYNVNSAIRHASASSDSENGIFNVSIGTGYELYYKRGFSMNIAANLDVLKTAFDGYSENGAGDKNLVIDKRETSLTVYSLKTQTSYARRYSGGLLMPQLDFAWKHAFDEEATKLRAYYLNDPNKKYFTFLSEVPDKDYFQLNLGLSYIINGGTTGFLDYQRTLGKLGYSQFNLSMGLRVPIN